MKKKIGLIIFVILLFIPSYIAIGYFSSTKGDPNVIDELKIEDLQGKAWTYKTEDDKKDGNSMIDVFTSIMNNADEIPSLPAQITDKGFYRVTVTSYGTEHLYQYYFDQASSDAYYTDSLGTHVYKIAESDAEKFLMSACAESVYTDGKLPQLLVGGENGAAVAPTSAVWSYKGYKDNIKTLDTASQLSTEDTVCSISGGFNIGFTTAPYYVSLIVKDGETELFNGSLENIDSLSLGDSDEIQVTVNARWLLTDDVTNEATYKFTGHIVKPATFYLGQTTVANGGFVVIGGKNVVYPNDIQFFSEPAIDYTPVFYKEGEYVYALVPIRYELETGEDRTFTFTLSYGGVSQTMNLTATSYKYQNSSSGITAAVEETTYSSAALAEADAALHELAKQELLSEEDFDINEFGKPFLENPVGGDELAENKTVKIQIGFGRYVTISETGTQYRHTGVDYHAPEGTEVYAVSSGTVVYSGYLTTTGNIVVIDHGLGLKSWYCHLQKCNDEIKVNDKISKGDVIGWSGDTGFASNNSTHVGLTVSDVPVCIYDLCETGIAVPKMD